MAGKIHEMFLFSPCPSSKLVEDQLSFNIILQTITTQNHGTLPFNAVRIQRLLFFPKPKQG